MSHGESKTAPPNGGDKLPKNPPLHGWAKTWAICQEMLQHAIISMMILIVVYSSNQILKWLEIDSPSIKASMTWLKDFTVGALCVYLAIATTIFLTRLILDELGWGNNH
jgi:hypothetical protein